MKTRVRGVELAIGDAFGGPVVRAVAHHRRLVGLSRRVLGEPAVDCHVEPWQFRSLYSDRTKFLSAAFESCISIQTVAT